MKSFTKKSLFKKRHTSEEMSLQITSMADIFTILLVFLLKSFAAGAVNVTPAQGMVLPQSFAAGDGAVEALSVQISEKSIQVEGEPADELAGYRFNAADLNEQGAPRKLLGALEEKRKRQLAIAQANPDVKPDSRIVIVADQKVPYATIKSVLSAAAIQGYTDFKLAVVKEGS